MATPAAHPSGVALWCKRCDVGFYGNACARQHQRFAFTKVLPLGQAPPAWGRALWAYGQDQEPQPGCLPFAPGALITVIPWGCGPAAKHAGDDNPGWLYGATEDGAHGLVPENYVELQYEGQAATPVAAAPEVLGTEPRLAASGSTSAPVVKVPEPEPEPEPEPAPTPARAPWARNAGVATRVVPPPVEDATEFLPGQFTETYDSRAQQQRPSGAQQADEAVARLDRRQQPQLQQPPQQPRQPLQPLQPTPPPVEVPAARVERPRAAGQPQQPPPQSAVVHEPRRGSLSDEQNAEIERRVADEVSRQLYRVDEEAQAEAVRLLDLKTVQDAEAERLREIGKQLLAEERQRGGQPLSAEAAAARAAEISDQFERSRMDEVERRRAEMEDQIRAETERRFAEELQKLQEREHESAALIQATFRGGQLRKHRGGKFGTQRREHSAATRIQAARRGMLGRRRATLHRQGRGAWESSLDGTLLRRLESRHYRSKDATAADLNLRRPRSSRHYMSRRTALYDTLLESVVELDRQRPLDISAAKFLSDHLTERRSSTANSKRQELSRMKLLALQKRAASEGVEEALVEEAMESVGPKAALVNLLLERNATTPAGRTAAGTADADAQLPELASDLRERLELAFAECSALARAAAGSSSAEQQGQDQEEDGAPMVPTARLERLLYTVSYRPAPDALEAAALAVDPDGVGRFPIARFIELMRAYSAEHEGWARRLRLAGGGATRHSVRSEPMAYYSSCGVREALVSALSHVDAMRPDDTEAAVELLAKQLARRAAGSSGGAAAVRPSAAATAAAAKPGQQDEQQDEQQNGGEAERQPEEEVEDT